MLYQFGLTKEKLRKPDGIRLPKGNYEEIAVRQIPLQAIAAFHERLVHSRPCVLFLLSVIRSYSLLAFVGCFRVLFGFLGFPALNHPAALLTKIFEELSNKRINHI